MKEKLPLYEWFFILAVFGLVLTLSTYSFLVARDSSQILEKEIFIPQDSEKISVKIEGEVRKKKMFRILKGTEFKEILKRVRLTRYADLKKIDPNKKLLESTSIVIPRLECITIYIEGAVEEPGVYELPLDVRVFEIKKLVKLLKNAERSYLKSRRLVKDREKFVIPYKQRVKDF